MLITICLSIKFWEPMLQVQKQLEALGHTVLTPPHQIPDQDGNMIPVTEYYRLRKQENHDWLWDRKSQAIQDHFAKVAKSEAILVLNYEKNNIPHYIGANTLLEMGLAFWLKKPIFLYHPIPEQLNYAEEIKGMKPIIINGDISLIRVN
jgi:hypothetical protein